MAISAKSGREFIAYKGNNLTKKDITSALAKYCFEGYVIKSRVESNSGENICFAKIVRNDYLGDREPYILNGKIVVCGYDQNDFSLYLSQSSDYFIEDSDLYHTLINSMYGDFKDGLFKETQNKLHFSTVIYDFKSNDIIAGMTKYNSSNIFTKLYYGYTKNGDDLIYSNSYELLKEFCDSIYEMNGTSYIKNGKMYDFDGNEIDMEVKPSTLSKKNRDTANAIAEGINSLLEQVTKESVEEIRDEYLKSSDSLNKISDFVSSKVQGETEKKMMETIDKVINDSDVRQKISVSLDPTIEQLLTEKISNFSLPAIYIIKSGDIEIGKSDLGLFHKNFEEVLTDIQLDEPVMLIGPAGAGKNHTIGQISKALGLDMYYTNNASNEFKITGFIDAGGTYRDTEFYKAFKNGGIFFLDEIDNSDPSALIVINSALANGYMAFPHETIDRHKDFRMVAAANTWGKGSDLQYVGRNALDAATLDRFDNVFFDYDRSLERALYPNNQVLDFMWSFRDAVESTKIPHVVSTRGIGKVYKKELNNIAPETILRTNVIKNLGQDDLNTLIGNMHNINDSNKYYSAAKTLKLGR